MKLNLTTQRKAVFDMVREDESHPTAAEIIERLRTKGYNFAYATVYNSLRYLTDNGLIRELKLGETASRYDARTDDHHHIVCSTCGRVDEVLTETPDFWMKSVADETAYTIQAAHVIFEGVCPACKTTNN
jgi:Fur family peroxide stress response transcriptional regulator